MGKIKYLYLIVGFVAGVAYLIACGGSTSSIAETIGNAIDVVYDNATSSLSATNVQAAIDEVTASLRNSSLTTGKLTSSSVVGNWSGTSYGAEGDSTTHLNLNADGSYSCGGGQYSYLADDSPICQQPISWDVVANAIRLKFNNLGPTEYRPFGITYLTSTTLFINYHGDYETELTKE